MEQLKGMEMAKRMEFVDTTNPEFKDMIGQTTDNWSIGNRVWFNDFRTSVIKEIQYELEEDIRTQLLTVKTLYSVYKFRLEI